MVYHIPLRKLRLDRRMSERELAEQAGISRVTLRQIEAGEGNPTLHSLHSVADRLERKLLVLLVPSEPCLSDYSTVAVSLKVLHDSFSSWKIHFLEMVDEFRKTADPFLVCLPPVHDLDFSLRALLSSITLSLCEEVGQKPPDWAVRRHFLPEPWFVSEVESLKALAIRDSPVAFRRNNIFVQENFLDRV